ncbi:hypothetical protein [Actinoplanes sp. NPDC051851]|uniref:hypothetical protein n=1 Tax=Actinoplanes sp. NPDC051851 TaxID=3154753 RepID=UPI00341DE99B
MRTTTGRCLETGITTVRLIGDLTGETIATVRAVVGKAAAECPTAVVVDLTAMAPAAPDHMSVFGAVTHQARHVWGVPVLLCAPTAELRAAFAEIRPLVALYDDHELARTAVYADVPHWVRRRLAPAAGSARAARVLLGDACRGWGLAHLYERARLIATELAANAITHAGTEFDVTAAYTGRFLRIAAQDGSPLIPHPRAAAANGSSPLRAGGLGLRAVAAASSHWGTTLIPGGKIVWSLLHADR